MLGRILELGIKFGLVFRVVNIPLFFAWLSYRALKSISINVNNNSNSDYFDFYSCVERNRVVLYSYLFDWDYRAGIKFFG